MTIRIIPTIPTIKLVKGSPKYKIIPIMPIIDPTRPIIVVKENLIQILSYLLYFS